MTAAVGIDQEPTKPGRHNARLTDGPRVWLVIASLRRLNGDVRSTAAEWGISEELANTAIDYYHRHRDLVDAQILVANEEHFA